MALEHGKEALGICRIAGLDDEVEDQAAAAGGEIELVTVVHIAAALDDDVGMRLEQADQLLAGRDSLAGEDATLGLADEALDEGEVMVDLTAPSHGFKGGADGQATGGMPERGQGGAGGCDQVSIELGLLFLAATVLDGEARFLASRR